MAVRRAFPIGPKIARRMGAHPLVPRGQELKLQPAIAIAPVIIGQATPQTAANVPCPAGGDLFGQMLRFEQHAAGGSDVVPAPASQAISGSRLGEVEPTVAPRSAVASPPPASGAIPPFARKDGRGMGSPPNSIRGHATEEDRVPNIPVSPTDDGIASAMPFAKAAEFPAPGFCNRYNPITSGRTCQYG